METTLKIDKEYLDILKELSKENGTKTQKEFVQSMILYFKETGIDPKAKNRSTAEELSKLRNTVIAFIREQEKKKLDPLIERMNETFAFLLDHYKNEAVTKADIKALLISQEKGPQHVAHDVKKDGNSDKLQQQIFDEKYKTLVSHVKGIFKDFEKNFKSSAFGGYSVDKATFDKYKTMFEKL
jgi:hypothetical protein